MNSSQAKWKNITFSLLVLHLCVSFLFSPRRKDKNDVLLLRISNWFLAERLVEMHPIYSFIWFVFVLVVLWANVLARLGLVWLYLLHNLDVCQWLRCSNLLFLVSRWMIGAFLVPLLDKFWKDSCKNKSLSIPMSRLLFPVLDQIPLQVKFFYLTEEKKLHGFGPLKIF